MPWAWKAGAHLRWNGPEFEAADAIPIQLNEIHSVENDGSEPLEIMMIGISRDNEKRVDVVEVHEASGVR